MAKSPPGEMKGRPTRIVAHRGARKEAPDNTGSAFDAAVACGVDGLEFDVQLTGDGVPVIYHDRTLARVGGGRFRVADRTLDELRSLDWGGWFHPAFTGEPLMTLGDVLARYGGRTRLFVEVKSRPRDRKSGRHLELALETAGLVRRHLTGAKVKKTVSLLSFDRDVLDAMHEVEPGWNYVLNLESPRDFGPGGLPRKARLMGCNLPVRRLTPSFADRVRRQGLEVMTYACNVPRQVTTALRCRADVIMTDNPRWLVKFLGDREEG